MLSLPHLVTRYHPFPLGYSVVSPSWTSRTTVHMSRTTVLKTVVFVLDTRWYPFPLVTRWYPFLDHFSVVFVLDAIPSTFGYSVVSLPFGLLGGIPFLDFQDHSAYVQDHGALGIARSALMICPGPRRSRLLCLRASLLECPISPLFKLERVSRLRVFSCEIFVLLARNVFCEIFVLLARNVFCASSLPILDDGRGCRLSLRVNRLLCFFVFFAIEKVRVK